MLKITMKKAGLSLLFIALICGIWGCVDRDFDTPPLSGEDPDIDASEIISIRDLLDIYDPGNFVEINRDKFLKVLVVADDRSGNFYRSLVVQDSTGGITMLLDDVELWNKYFVGKRLYIDLSDLWISDYNGLPQIGYAPFDDGDNLSLGRIPAVLLNEIIIGGSYNHDINAELHTIPELSGEDLNTLITLENIQFVESSLNESYADAQNLQAVNHVLEDCDGNTIILRTSGFADFAGMEVPSGNGSITAVYSIFGNDKQLLLRATDDIAFDGSRCDGEIIEIDEEEIISISQLLEDFMQGVEISLYDKYLKATVISSDEAGNFFKSLVVEDETGGIAILVDKFDLFEKYPPGQVVYVHLRDLCLSDYNGLPQLCYTASGSNVKRIPEAAVDNIIIPAADFEVLQPEITSIENLEFIDLNTLVQLPGVQFVNSSAGKPFADAANMYSVNHTIEDCDGNTIILRTSGFADFADVLTPPGNGSLTGVVQIFEENMQIFLRDESDVNMTNPRCGDTGGGGSIFIDFENQEDFEPISLPGWTNVALEGDRLWVRRSFGSNGFAEIEAYQDPAPLTDSWLITPSIITSETPELSFQSAMAFYKHDGATVYVSTDFTGSVEAATWEELAVRLATETDGDFNWVDSGVVDLSQYGDKLHVAFRYVGTAAQNTTKFRVDNIKIE